MTVHLIRDTVWIAEDDQHLLVAVNMQTGQIRRPGDPTFEDVTISELGDLMEIDDYADHIEGALVQLHTVLDMIREHPNRGLQKQIAFALEELNCEIGKVIER